MDDKEIKNLIEASLFMAGRALTLEEIARICESGNLGRIRVVLEGLIGEYSGRGIEIIPAGNSYVMSIKKELEKKVMNLAPHPEIGPSMLKTLGLIAYKQPVRQAEIIKQRGQVYDQIKKLCELGFVEARVEGRSKILRTAKKFDEYFRVEEKNKNGGVFFNIKQAQNRGSQ